MGANASAPPKSKTFVPAWSLSPEAVFQHPVEMRWRIAAPFPLTGEDGPQLDSMSVFHAGLKHRELVRELDPTGAACSPKTQLAPAVVKQTEWRRRHRALGLRRRLPRVLLARGCPITNLLG